MISSKIHTSYRSVVALCDVSLIGKKFEEDKRQLDCTGQFFKGKEITHEEAVALIKKQAREDSTFNIVGPESLKAAEDAGLISKENIAHVQDIPFTLILL